MTIHKKTTITETATLLFSMLFLYTGISKLTDYLVFKEQIAASPILESVAPLIATILPWMEFIAVFLLLIPKWRLSGLYLSTILMMLFTAYITAILIFSKDIPCSCGGIIALLSWKQHLVFNSIFILLGIVGVTAENRLRKENKTKLTAINTNYVI